MVRGVGGLLSLRARAIACALTLAACSGTGADRGDGGAGTPSQAVDRVADTTDWTMLGGDLASTYHARSERVLSVLEIWPYFAVFKAALYLYNAMRLATKKRGARRW